jgi:pyruvate dehydrogenase (quinone)
MATIAADYMVDALVNAGVKRVFGVVGDSLRSSCSTTARWASWKWR